MTRVGDYTRKLESTRRRIDALRTSVAMPGRGARSGLSAQIAALADRHRATSADFVRFTSTPESEEDWQVLRKRLDEALADLESRLGPLEEATASHAS